MVDRTAKLEAALRVNAALRVQAERLIAAYVAPESDRAAPSQVSRRELERVRPEPSPA